MYHSDSPSPRTALQQMQVPCLHINSWYTALAKVTPKSYHDALPLRNVMSAACLVVCQAAGEVCNCHQLTIRRLYPLQRQRTGVVIICAAENHTVVTHNHVAQYDVWTHTCRAPLQQEL